jgi:hypothetical protein
MKTRQQIEEDFSCVEFEDFIRNFTKEEFMTLAKREFETTKKVTRDFPHYMAVLK